MGKKVNQTELAEILGVSDVTLWQWQKEGMPIEERNLRGQSNSYDAAEVIAWMVKRAEEKVRKESPRDELARAQTALARLQVAEKEGQLVSVAEFEPEYARLVLACRQRLLQIPARMELEEKKRARLEEMVDEALRELSSYEPGAGADQPVGAPPGAAVA
jgi:terminase small subunit / prophage DNA-packing protein